VWPFIRFSFAVIQVRKDLIAEVDGAPLRDRRLRRAAIERCRHPTTSALSRAAATLLCCRPSYTGKSTFFGKVTRHFGHGTFYSTYSFTGFDMVNSADATKGLDALANLLTELSVSPFDINHHVQHINLARSLDMEEQVSAAQEMAANYLAVGDDVWLPLIEAKTSSSNLENPAEVLEVLELYARAEADYLCT
jgi:hypothetical protein